MRNLTTATVLAVSASLAIAGTSCRQRHEPPALRPAARGARQEPAMPAMPAGVKIANLACELLTRQDAQELLGGPVKPPVTSMSADIGVVSSRCGYISESQQPVRVVSLLARRWRQAAEARQAYEHAHALSQSISGQAPETIAGLGDRAYWAGGTVTQLNILAGDTWLIVTSSAPPGGDPLIPDKAAAQKILSHLR